MAGYAHYATAEGVLQPDAERRLVFLILADLIPFLCLWGVRYVRHRPHVRPHGVVLVVTPVSNAVKTKRNMSEYKTTQTGSRNEGNLRFRSQALEASQSGSLHSSYSYSAVGRPATQR